MTRTALSLHLFVFLLTSFFVNPRPTQAISYTKNILPDFADFHRTMRNGEADVLRGVYVPNVLALPVVQQPANQPYYVSNSNGEITQFALALQYGNIGLLAHNTLSGRLFPQLAIGQQVRLVYGDGNIEDFVVEDILRFQALQPASVSSTFRNLDKEEILSTVEMFNRAYVGERHVVFQTCIEAEGNASWGRLFVIAVRKE